LSHHWELRGENIEKPLQQDSKYFSRARPFNNTQENKSEI